MLDGGFAHPEVLEFLDAQPKCGICGGDGQECGVEARRRKRQCERARQLSRRSGKTEHIYGEVRYKAGKLASVCAASSSKPRSYALTDKDPKDNPAVSSSPT